MYDGNLKMQKDSGLRQQYESPSMVIRPFFDDAVRTSTTEDIYDDTWNDVNLKQI